MTWTSLWYACPSVLLERDCMRHAELGCRALSENGGLSSPIDAGNTIRNVAAHCCTLKDEGLTGHEKICVLFLREQPVDIASTVAKEWCRRHSYAFQVRSLLSLTCPISCIPAKMPLSRERAKRERLDVVFPISHPVYSHMGSLRCVHVKNPVLFHTQFVGRDKKDVSLYLYALPCHRTPRNISCACR